MHVEKFGVLFLHCFVEEEPYWNSQERVLNNKFEFSERRLKNLEIFCEVSVHIGSILAVPICIQYGTIWTNMLIPIFVSIWPIFVL
jgi:hypothetical protein